MSSALKLNCRPVQIILMRNSAKAIVPMREFPVHRKTQFPPSFVSLRKCKFVWESAGDWRLIKSTTGSTQTALILSPLHLLLKMSATNPPDQLTECDVDNCPGLCEEASLLCVICLAAVHPTCFMMTISKLSEYPGSSDDEVFCSDVCCLWHGKEGVDVEGIRDEHSKLLALKKKQLVKLASVLQVRVMHRINGASQQISKPMMVRRLVAAKFGASVEQASTPSRKGQSKKKHKTTTDEPAADKPAADEVVYVRLMLEPLDGSR
jgi:hypothetical protein